MKSVLEIDDEGNKYWWKDDKLHREDGPAVEYIDGEKRWCQNGEFHRLDGPAIELGNGYKEWYIEGKIIDCTTQQEFEKLLKLKAFW